MIIIIILIFIWKSNHKRKFDSINLRVEYLYFDNKSNLITVYNQCCRIY